LTASPALLPVGDQELRRLEFAIGKGFRHRSAGSELIAWRRSQTLQNRIFLKQLVDPFQLAIPVKQLLGLLENVIGHQINED
jgi:hypothetical protein